MVFIKIPLIVSVTLVTITAINQRFENSSIGSTNDQSPEIECRNLLAEDHLFRTGNEHGKRNFTDSFRYLSKKQLLIKFREPYQGTDELPEVKAKRKLKLKLAYAYFSDLLRGHKIYVDDMDPPVVWCKTKAVQVHRILEIALDTVLSLDGQIERCAEYINKILLLRSDSNLKLSDIFEILYKYFSYDDLTYFGVKGSNLTPYHIVGTNEWRDDFYITHYVLGYFKYFEHRVIHQEEDNGRYRSVRQFCENKGHVYVTQERNTILLE